MNQGPIWGRFMKKTGGQKSRATVPLNNPPIIVYLSDIQKPVHLATKAWGKIG
jgi:hypothetical protein